MLRRGLIQRTRGNNYSYAWTYFGKSISLPHCNAFFGLHQDAWARYQSTPLWLRFPVGDWGRAREVKAALHRWETETPKRLFVHEDDSAFVPLFIPPSSEQDDMVEHVVRQLAAVDTELAAAGLVRGTAPAPDA